MNEIMPRRGFFKRIAASIGLGGLLVALKGSNAPLPPAQLELRPENVSELQRFQIEADYILTTQKLDTNSGVYGAFNNIYPTDGKWSWIVPRENGMAILGLLLAAEKLNGKQINGQNVDTNKYRLAAETNAKFLASIQEKDGSWGDQYYEENSEAKRAEDQGKSPTQTAEVMMAYGKLGFNAEFLDSMTRGADYLLSCQDIKNKGGVDDGLISGGKQADETYHGYKWASDNAYAYQALIAASKWCQVAAAGNTNMVGKAKEYFEAAKRIENALNTIMFNSETGVWHSIVNQKSQAVNDHNTWINYAPLMLDVPLPTNFDRDKAAEWIHNTLQTDRGAFISNTSDQRNRLSPGFSFQGAIAFFKLGTEDAFNYANTAIDWAMQSRLWGLNLYPRGSFIDWIRDDSDNTLGHHPNQKDKRPIAGNEERFIDTSLYAMAAWNGGYSFAS